jgi:hypothetical protein
MINQLSSNLSSLGVAAIGDDVEKDNSKEKEKEDQLMKSTADNKPERDVRPINCTDYY